MKNKQKFDMIITIIMTATFKRAEFLMFKEWWMDERLPVLKQKENAYIFTPMMTTVIIMIVIIIQSWWLP